MWLTCDKGLHKRAPVTPDLLLLHATECEGVETPGPLNKPITLHKAYDDKKLCLFPTQLWGQMRRTTQWGATCRTSLCKAFSPFTLRVWGFCLALVIPEGSKQPAKNSPHTKRQEEMGEQRLTAETSSSAVRDNAQLNGVNAFITRSKERPTSTDDLIHLYKI